MKANYALYSFECLCLKVNVMTISQFISLSYWITIISIVIQIAQYVLWKKYTLNFFTIEITYALPKNSGYEYFY